MSTHRITDIEMRRFPQRVMFSPGLRTLLQVEADYVAALYRAKVNHPGFDAHRFMGVQPLSGPRL